MGLKLADLKQKELDGCRLCPASHLNKRLACMGLHSYVNIYIYIYTYVHIHMYIYIECVCIYMTMHVYIYIHNYVLYIYICTSIYIYTQPNLMREGDCTDMFVDNFLFYG